MLAHLSMASPTIHQNDDPSQILDILGRWSCPQAGAMAMDANL